MSVTQEQIDFYEKNGFVVVPNFLSPKEVQELKDECKKLIDQHIRNPDDQIQLKDLGSKKWATTQYRTAVFLEPRATQNGELVVDQNAAVHKVAHGLQFDEEADATKKHLYSEKMKQLVKDLTNQESPKVIQVMYLLKPPVIGEPRPPHQDETYLQTEPQGHVFGVWIALDDATEENGCLDFVPGSHKTVPLTRFFRKLPEPEGDLVYKYSGDAEYMHPDSKYEYIRCQVKSGDLVMIHGLVLHKSDPNMSGKSRWAWSFHAYDAKDGVKWRDDNAVFDSERLPYLYGQESVTVHAS